VRLSLQFVCSAPLLTILACGGITQVDSNATSTGGSASIAEPNGVGGISSTSPATDGGSSTSASGASTPSFSDASTAVTGAATMPFACGPTWTADHASCGISVGGCAVAICVPCTSTDQQLCYRTCGPVNSGFRAVTCSGGTYVEQPDCSFDPACDFSCFKLPDVADAACPTTAPTHGTPCSLPPCVVCGGTASSQTTGYLDAKRSAKIGYCVCLPATATTTQKWSCATAGTAWPCPGHAGC
jgi:hypothetical protein